MRIEKDFKEFIAPGRVIQLGHAPVRIDIVTSIDGVGFAAAWKKRLREI